MTQTDMLALAVVAASASCCCSCLSSVSGSVGAYQYYDQLLSYVAPPPAGGGDGDAPADASPSPAAATPSPTPPAKSPTPPAKSPTPPAKSPSPPAKAPAGGKPVPACAKMPKKLAPYISKWRPVQPYKLSGYPALVANKRRVNAAIRHLPEHERLLLIAMAMQETNEMTAKQRDAGKDAAGGAANVSLWNLNVDMLQRLGYKGDFRKLNDDANVRIAADLMHKAFAKWGLDRTLAFVRGGYTGFMDGKSYGVADFRSGVATIAAVLCHRSPAILTNDQRVEVQTAHV